MIFHTMKLHESKLDPLHLLQVYYKIVHLRFPKFTPNCMYGTLKQCCVLIEKNMGLLRTKLITLKYTRNLVMHK